METAEKTALTTSELRRGNWVSKVYDIDDLVTFHQVKEIKEESVLVNNNVQLKRLEPGQPLVADNPMEIYRYVPIEVLKGIPLTSEILEKSGFVNIEKGGWLSRMPNGIVKYRITGTFYEVMIGEIIFSHIKHLHQLQNLYFALTGEELKIEL